MLQAACCIRAGYRQLAMSCSPAHSHAVHACQHAASSSAVGQEVVLDWLQSRETQQVAAPLHTMAGHQLMPLCPLPAANNIAQALVSLLQTELDSV